MKSNICLIRHGLTEGNLRRLYYGASDISLSGKGEEELRRLAAEGIYPAAEEADFYTTGLIWTEQTLKLIYGEQEHQVLPLLKESVLRPGRLPSAQAWPEVLLFL